MNKNAAIIEGDITKKFNPVSKVKVSNSDTGESTWIPEDSKETHSLSVTKNGIYYAASEGYTAYDTVTVNVSSETEVNYEGILMDMPDLADLGLYDLDDLEGLEGLDLDLEELQDLENLILDGDLEEGELPDSGATIKGIDPDSGETLEVGLDEDGNLMEQALPDHIHIVVWPRKRHYQEGEIIDFSGIHVYLMKKGTERFTCEQYPTGEIPFEDLIFPVITASGSSDGGKTSDLDTGSIVEKPIPVSSSIVISHGKFGNVEPWFTDTYQSSAVLLIGNIQIGETIPYFEIIVASSENGNYTETTENHYTHETVNHQYVYYSTYTHNGKTVYYSAKIILPSGDKAVSYQGAIIQKSISSSVGHEDEIAWTMIYGEDEGGSNEIPVQWMRSDGEILEDTYEITIGDGEDPEPEPDPYAGQCDFIWEGKKYCFNKSLARSEVMYSNGTVWQTWLGGQSPPYTVDQALKLKLIVQVGWSGGGSTSGGF